MTERPAIICHWRDIQWPDDEHYHGSRELLSIRASFSHAIGLTKIGVNHEVLPPGRRTSWPHAERDEEEFVFVIDGTPDVWLDGELHRLAPGDGVGFAAGTGITHTFINNTNRDVQLLVVGERSRPESRTHYPMHPRRNAEIGGLHWHDAPTVLHGDHDGKPDALRTQPVDPD